jgi:hypothetical protein
MVVFLAFLLALTPVPRPLPRKAGRRLSDRLVSGVSRWRMLDPSSSPSASEPRLLERMPDPSEFFDVHHDHGSLHGGGHVDFP